MIRGLLRGLFRVFYEIDIKGLEHVPQHGPIIFAANHINYFDAPLLLAFLPRHVHFISVSTAFKVPVWASLLRLFGTIPIEKDKAAAETIKASIAVLNDGHALGIFPEGTFTTDGHAVPAKKGTAHIAVKAGAPIIPVSITGAFHSWPAKGPGRKRLPRPWRLGIKIHEPIPIEEPHAAHDDEKAAEKAVTNRLMEELNRTLEPAFRAEVRIDSIIHGRAARVRLYELFPLFLCLVATACLGWRSEWFSHPETTSRALLFLAGFLGIGAVYFAYLVVDLLALHQTAWSRAFRDFSPFIFLLIYYPLLTRCLPFVVAPGIGPVADHSGVIANMRRPANWFVVDFLYLAYYTLVPYFLVAARFYHFRKHRRSQRFVRGFLLCTYLALVSIMVFPSVGGRFDLIVPADALGLVVRFANVLPGRSLAVNSFPVVILTLTSYCLLFDWFYCRRRFNFMLAPSLCAVASAVVLRGYPLQAVAATLCCVLFVLAYMACFRVRGYDGRPT